MIANSTSDSEIFAVVTQFYVRLRRVTGRVIDVLYMVENQEYAKHMIHYAKDIDDAELQRHVSSLNALISPTKNPTPTNTPIEQAPEQTAAASKTSGRNNQATWFLG